MAITQEVNIEMLEKLPDGNFKIKYPKSKAENIIGLDRYAATTGSANTYVASIPGIAGLVAGLRITLKINVANTGASTININSLGAKSIRKAGGAALTNGNLKTGGIYTLVYDGTNFQLQGEGIFDVNDIGAMAQTGGTFTGKTIFQNNTDYSKQGRNITLSTADPSGGASGDVWIKYKA